MIDRERESEKEKEKEKEKERTPPSISFVVEVVGQVDSPGYQTISPIPPTIPAGSISLAPRKAVQAVVDPRGRAAQPQPEGRSSTESTSAP